MNEEKKTIEEMAKAIFPYYNFCRITECEDCNRRKLSKCRYYSFAKRCVMNGYRKQSDTVKEFLKLLKEKESPKLLMWEYGEGYLDCIKIAEELAVQYGVEVKNESSFNGV